MEKQHTHTLSKIISLFIIIMLTITFTGCQKEIPEGDIKDFVMAFNYDNAYKNVLYGASTVTSSNYKENVEQGHITTYTYIDKREQLYHYSKTVLSGNYYGTGEDQFTYYEKETLTYIDEQGYIVAYEKTDGKIEKMSYRREDLDTLINYFYFTSSEYNYHTGGVYYGDYILANCGKHYKLFSLNEEKSELTYSVNVYANDSNGEEILTMHNYKVNKLGMVLNLSTTSLYKEDTSTYTKTTMDCDYITNFKKIFILN